MLKISKISLLYIELRTLIYLDHLVPLTLDKYITGRMAEPAEVKKMKMRNSENGTDTKKTSPILRREILRAVENQIRDENPLITKKTLERLMKKGYSREDAVVLIGSALLTEIYWILKNEEPFNEERYTKELNALE